MHKIRNNMILIFSLLIMDAMACWHPLNTPLFTTELLYVMCDRSLSILIHLPLASAAH